MFDLICFRSSFRNDPKELWVGLKHTGSILGFAEKGAKFLDGLQPQERKSN